MGKDNGGWGIEGKGGEDCLCMSGPFLLLGSSLITLKTGQ